MLLFGVCVVRCNVKTIESLSKLRVVYGRNPAIPLNIFPGGFQPFIQRTYDRVIWKTHVARMNARMDRNTLQQNVTHCNSLQHAVLYWGRQESDTRVMSYVWINHILRVLWLFITATHFSCTATHCNTLCYIEVGKRESVISCASYDFS